MSRQLGERTRSGIQERSSCKHTLGMSVCVCVYLQLPEDAACVSVIVVSQRDVFNSSLVVLQVKLHMFEEPGLEVEADSIDLQRNLITSY